MGINVTQKMIIGIALDSDECHYQKSPAVYDEQPRYDTKTGVQTHTERVLVKEEETYFKFRDVVEENEGFHYFIEVVGTKYNLDVAVDEESEIGYIGYNCGLNNGSYSFDLLEGSLSIDDINDNVTALKEIFLDEEIGIHFVGYVG